MGQAAKPTADGAKRRTDDLFGSDGLLARTEAKLLHELATQPDKPKTLWQLATVQRRRGNLAAALDTCRRIAPLLPDHPLVRWTEAVLTGANLRTTPTPKGHAPVPFERLHGFLPPDECDALLRFAVSHRDQFVPGRVTGCNLRDGELRPETRRALVAVERKLQGQMSWFKAKLAGAAENALGRLPVRDLESHEIELNLTAHRDGDFFRVHMDGDPVESDRRLSYVYYFHRQPRRFSGGDLLLYDTNRQENGFRPGVFTRIEPLHNSIVFFPSDCYHEITPVSGAQDFADARFTVNGWFLKPEKANASPA